MKLAPCPATSVLDRPDNLPECLRFPALLHGARTGRLIWQACGASCTCCGAFSRTLGKELASMEPEAVAGRWRGFVLDLAEMDPDSRLAVNVARMKKHDLI